MGQNNTTVQDVTVGGMSPATFDRLRRIVYDQCGISLGDNKLALVRARVAKRIRALKLNDYEAYLEYLTRRGGAEEIQHLVDAISTNVTSFYRESVHFDYLREIIRSWMARGQNHFRFWSAAASTGEEPYTLAIEILEAVGSHSVNSRILATDINTQVLELCLRGEYTADKVQPVPKALLHRYFTHRKENGSLIYSVNRVLRDMILFRQLNLSTTPYPIKTPLDMIFCRNVMIYFDKQVRARLLGEFHRLLKPGGYLMVGHAESITSMAHGFDCLKPSVYRKK